MAATARQAPRRCPVCGQPYAFRVRSRQDDQLGLGRHYRHTPRWRPWVYIHRIPTAQAQAQAQDGGARDVG